MEKKISQEYIDLVEKISNKIELPVITDIYIPSRGEGGVSCQKNAFGAMILEDKYVGVIYLNLSEGQFVQSEMNEEDYVGKSPVDISKHFLSKNETEKTLGLGAINAISQYVLAKSSYELEKSKDSLGNLDPTQDDNVGMVGFFPPLVRQLKDMNVPITIIEKKESMVSENKNWKVTLDPRELKECNKILCTSTVVLNESIDDIMENCTSAERISIVGPTGGYLPDPIFKRGVTAIGGTQIQDTPLFMSLIKSNQRWGPSTFKYIIQKETYPGIDKLLESIDS